VHVDEKGHVSSYFREVFAVMENEFSTDTDFIIHSSKAGYWVTWVIYSCGRQILLEEQYFLLFHSLSENLKLGSFFDALHHQNAAEPL